MDQQDTIRIDDMLVAASVADQHGFTETQAALQKMAKCAICPLAMRCDGRVCVFEQLLPSLHHSYWRRT